MDAPLLKPRFWLREHWPWLLGAATTVLLELLQPYALQQLSEAVQQWLAMSEHPQSLPMLPALVVSVALVGLPQPLCRGQGASSSFMIFLAALLLPLLISAGLLSLDYGYMPFAAMIGVWVATSFHFVRQLRETQQKLLHAQRHAETTLQAIADAVMNVLPDGTLCGMNCVATGLVRNSNGRTGQHISVALGLPGRLAQQLEEQVAQCVREGRTVRIEQPIVVGERQMRVTAGPIFDSDGCVRETVLVLTDISDSVAAQDRLYHEATHDALTGLPNRALLMRRMTEAVSYAMQNNAMAAILFVDVDHFNRINDSFGHYIGDAILIEVAHRLQAVAKPGHVARWGGDEYVVLLDGITDRDAAAATAAQIVKAVNVPMNINGATLRVNCSVGISLAPADSINIEELLAMADTAMSRSKSSGDGTYRYFSAAMSRDATNEVERALREALQKNEFDLYFQPQVSIADGHLVGMEALLRWARPGRGLVPPDHFVPVAEEIGLIIDIGVWAIHRAAQQIKTWQEEGLPVVPISVNVSPRQCLDHRITKVIADAVRYAGISPDLLKIELTEATAMNNVDHVASLLRSVHGLGVRISVDDFGTGYSSLSFLKRFPISQLKIDRSFVSDITVSPDDAAIVSGTIALARGLGIEVVAEGVETAEQMQFLAERGCDLAQGYFISHPLTAAAAREYLRSHAPKLKVAAKASLH